MENQLLEDTITVLSKENERLKRKVFFVTKDNHQLNKDMKKALIEIESLELEYKRLTGMLAKLGKGRI